MPTATMILATILLLAILALISFATSLGIIRFATRTGKMLDRDSTQKPQKMHFGDIPRAGGIGIFVAFSAGIALFVAFGALDSKYLWLIIPSFFILWSGILEDFGIAISPSKRLLLQTLWSALVIYIFQNCVLTYIGFSLPYGFALIFTIFCIVGVTNAMNIIDGFNGLSGGYALLVGASIAVISFVVGNFAVFFMVLILMSSIAGFFILNFPRGRIFLGDGGAYLIGFLFAFLLITLTQDSRQYVSAYYGLCVMIYPVFEVLFSMWRRKVWRKKEATQADSLHIHQLIFRRKTRVNHQTAVILWLFNAPFIILASVFYNHTIALGATILAFIALYLRTYLKMVRFKPIL